MSQILTAGPSASLTLTRRRFAPPGLELVVLERRRLVRLDSLKKTNWGQITFLYLKVVLPLYQTTRNLPFLGFHIFHFHFREKFNLELERDYNQNKKQGRRRRRRRRRNVVVDSGLRKMREREKKELDNGFSILGYGNEREKKELDNGFNGV